MPRTYKLIDMAKDTVGLMDALGIKSAHLVGASMGGMIAQEVTLSFPQRVRSLTSIMSTTGNPACRRRAARPPPMLMAPPPAQQGRVHRALRSDLEGAARRLLPGRRKRSIPAAPRACSRAGSIRPASAASCAPCSPPAAARNGCQAVKTPSLVIHGTVDPLVRPEGGKDTAASIPGAKLLMIDGMGHALPARLWPQIIDAIDKHAHGAAAKAA